VGGWVILYILAPYALSFVSFKPQCGISKKKKKKYFTKRIGQME